MLVGDVDSDGNNDLIVGHSSLEEYECPGRAEFVEASSCHRRLQSEYAG